MSLAGNLRLTGLTDLLRMIEHGQRTGVLTLVRGKLQAAIYFSAGQWVLAERIGVGMALAQQLVQAGYLTKNHFEAVMDLPLSQAGSVSDLQTVRALINGHVLSQEELRAYRQNDARSLLSVLLSWPDGDFMFEEGAPLPAGRVALPLPIAQLVTQARVQARGTLPVREVVPLSPETVIALADIDPESGMAVQLTRDQWRLLTLVDGKAPLWAITRSLAAPEVTILRLAAELYASGVVTVTGRVSQS